MSPLAAWVVVLTGFSCVCGFASAVALLRAKALRQQTLLIEERLTDVEAQLNTALSGSIGMGKRIVNLEKRLHKLAAEQENNASAVDEFSYGQALQMLKQGADVEAVASNCGFSNSEAQLMQLVQKHLHNPAPEPTSNDS